MIKYLVSVSHLFPNFSLIGTENSLLLIATNGGFFEILKYFLSFEIVFAMVEKTPQHLHDCLNSSARFGHFEIFKFLLEFKGCTTFSIRSEHIRSCMNLAVLNSRKEIENFIRINYPEIAKSIHKSTTFGKVGSYVGGNVDRFQNQT